MLNNYFQFIMKYARSGDVFQSPVIFLVLCITSGFSGADTPIDIRPSSDDIIFTSAPAFTNNKNISQHSDYTPFLQTTSWTCGPAALRFILSRYDIEITEDKLAKLSGTQVNVGTTLLGLKQSAESLGVKAKGQRWNWARLIQEKNPVLAYISDSHYVVILASDAKTVTFFDPELGKATHSREDFSARWDGIVLAFPTQTLETSSFALPPTSSIPQKSGLALSLKKAVKMALSDGTSIKAAEERLKLSQAQLDSVFANYTPKTELVFSASRNLDEIDANQTLNTTTQNEAKYQWKMDKLVSSNLGGKLSTTVDIGVAMNDLSTPGQNEKQYTLGPGINIDYLQPLTKDGRVAGYAPLSRSLNTWRTAQNQYDLDQQNIIFEVIGSYYNFVKAVQLVKFTEENLKQTRKQLETAKIQFKLGNLAEIEASKMEVQLSRDQSNLIDAKRSYKSSQEQLAILIGQPTVKHINPVQDINYSPVDADQNNMINKALEERKELKHFLYTRENLNLDLSDAKSTDDSSLSLNASFRRRGEQPRFNGALNGIEQDSWRIGATVTIPLNDNGTTKSRTAQILSQIFDLSVSIRRTKDQISFEVNEAIRNLQSTKVRYEILEKTLKLAEENLSIDELRFSRGVIASNDLQRTQLELLQLKVDRFSALVDYKLSEIELTKAVGVLGTDSL
ncbi:hypothetical protein MNBD_GAMMA19-2269 [hydrothermal vent metagenome]|uniref:Peptidase C39 domain-containing protein n=1 Tax=hydrothermal vent metagenome TaxID=652676 RepID=A0A3B1B9B1_9ZZZZ